jgi:hypothetical protein
LKEDIYVSTSRHVYHTFLRGLSATPIFVGVIIFGSVRFLPIKNNQIGFFFKIKTESNRPVSVRSGLVLDLKKPRKPMTHFLSLVTIKQNKLSKILFEIELVLFEK